MRRPQHELGSLPFTNTALDSTVRDNLDAYFVARLGA